jgi:NAD(P)-dependent dehydrogenase (short-subunit alcohol dehydrogenase family)
MSQGLRKELALLAGLASIGFGLMGKRKLAIAAGVIAGGLPLLPVRAFAFSGRTAIITGGSRGLGFALAENLLKENANVTLLARDAEELKNAQAKLRERTTRGQILIIPCDVTQPEQLAQAFQQAQSRFDRLDLLINNAGSISVGPFETMEADDFDAELNLQLHAVVQGIRLALPAFRRLKEGRIINISSIGGAVPVPHMSSYCAAKFALAGLSETVTAELAPENIKVTTVYPGLMRTGSPIQAVFKGNHEKEYSWFASGDVLPGLSVSADYAAQRIIEASRDGETQVRFPWVTQMGILGHALLPETYALIMRQMARFMPKGNSKERMTGEQSRGWLERQFWYKPLQGIERSAEAKWNQTGKVDANFNLGLTSS